MERIGELRVFPGVHRIGIAENVGENLGPILMDPNNEAEQAFEVVKIENGQTPTDLTRNLNDEEIDALVTRTELNINQEVLEETGLAVVVGACKDPKVAKDAARKTGTEVIRSDVNTEAVVRLVQAKLLGASTGQSRGILATSNHDWRKKELGPERFDLQGKTLAIYGFGHIGQAVAKMAKALGMKVIAYNHRSTENRDYDVYLRGVAKGMGVEMVDKDTLLSECDILTLHVGSDDYAGRSNNNIISKDDLRKMGGKNSKGRQKEGILINCARWGVLPCEADIRDLIEEGSIKLYDTDVFESRIERPDAFQSPMGNSDYRMMGTPHIGGSERGLAEKTAEHIGTRLPEWIRHGNLRSDSNRYPHQDLRYGLMVAGTLGIAITRSTEKYTLDGIGNVVRELDLEVLGQDQLDDFMPGETGEEGKWKHVPHIMCLNGFRDYEEAVRGIVGGFVELNTRKSGVITAVRIIPTSAVQRAFLANQPRFAPNLREI